MIGQLVTAVKRPYPLNLSIRRMLPYILAFGFSISLFLFIFQPFGLNNYTSSSKNYQIIGLGFVVVITLSTNLLIFPKLLPALFSEDIWSIGREISWNIWLCLTTIFISSIYWSYVTGQTLSPYYIYRSTLNSLLFTIFVLPLGVLCTMSNYLKSLKAKLKKAEELTLRLTPIEPSSSSQAIELRSETGKEKIKLKADKLLYIQSCDNYANIILRNNGKNEQRLIRSSLINLEKQIRHPFIVRCHRSFIVNLSQTHSVIGNSRNYTLFLKGSSQLIPVSRHSEKNVLKALHDLTH